MTENDRNRKTRPKQTLAVMVLLCLATALSYHGVLQNGFVSFDDIEYIFDNKHVYDGLTFNGVVWALKTTYLANWTPLTWLSHMTDMSLFGADPRGHHLTSLVLHMGNVLLLLVLLMRMTGSLWRSAAVSALFALHPLQVESVAWVAERKTVLCTLFFLLTLLAYCRYTRMPTVVNYAVILLAFTCSLVSKPMMVGLPLILLLLDIWPLRRTVADNPNHSPDMTHSPMGLITEKIPLLVLAAASCLITIVVQQNEGAIKWSGAISLAENTAHALVNYIKYLFVILWPVNLAVLYPYERILPLWQTCGALAVLVLISVVAIRSMAQRPYWAFGWFWFLIALLPVVGFIRIGAHSIADRYTYIPLIGISVALVWTLGTLLEKMRWGRVVAVTGAVLLFGVLSGATMKQVGYWKDSISLFEHAISVTNNNWLAHNNITIELVKQGEIGKALVHAQESIRINPQNPDAYYNLGKIYANLGDNTQSIRAYQTVIAYDPGNGSAYLKLAIKFFEMGDTTSALEMYRALERIDPEKARYLMQPQTPARQYLKD